MSKTFWCLADSMLLLETFLVGVLPNYRGLYATWPEKLDTLRTVPVEWYCSLCEQNLIVPQA